MSPDASVRAFVGPCLDDGRTDGRTDSHVDGHDDGRGYGRDDRRAESGEDHIGHERMLVPAFRSDNVSGVCAEVIAALANENDGDAPAYGEDGATRRLDDVFSDLFEREVSVYPLVTGTAANALAISSIAPAYTSVLCHRDAHIVLDEAGAVEFYGDVRLVPSAGDGGKLTPQDIARAMSGRRSSGTLEFSAISIAQPTESGLVYSREEMTALCEAAKRFGLAVHMDGARFANAVASLGCSPAEISWRAGVDILSFGATKNGAMAAEAVVVFEHSALRDLPRRRKRCGQTLSKMRFISVQLLALIDRGVWLRNAQNANAQAAALASGLSAIAGVELIAKVESNQIFVRLPEHIILDFAERGIQLYRWGANDSNTVRLVTSFDTRAAHVISFLRLAQDSAHRHQRPSYS